MTSRRALLTLVILNLQTFLTAEIQRAPLPAIDELVLRVQNRYDSVRDLSANFEHRYSGGVLRTSIVEYGTVLIKKPGKMRWRYTSSEEKLYVSDGNMFYSYFPVDRQLLISQMSVDDMASTPALFLAGKSSLVSNFKAEYADDNQTANHWTVDLTPNEPTDHIQSITLTINRSTLAITGLATQDIQGGRSSYIFTNLVENSTIPESVFDFTIPDNIEVIHQGNFAH